MPMLPSRRCQGCGHMVAGSCPTCAKQQQQRSDRSRRDERHRALLRTERWKRYSKARLARLPVCGQRENGERDTALSRCARLGLFTLAEVTDHVIPVNRGGSMWSPQNHMSACADCNRAKGDRLDAHSEAAGSRGDDDSLVFA
jgi:5-methylcytosine-specific restriction endonuclease McrA